MELEKANDTLFGEILAVLQKHEDFKRYELKGEDVLSIPGLEIHPHTRKVYSGQREIELTTKEYDLISLLVVNRNRVLTYEQIYEVVWGDFSSGNERKVISFHMRNLRKKLYSTTPIPPFTIESVREVGYRLKSNDVYEQQSK
jgi:DNA-binding response OmpR family regulator